jgi:hypothetical protein
MSEGCDDDWDVSSEDKFKSMRSLPPIPADPAPSTLAGASAGAGAGAGAAPGPEDDMVK